MRNAPVGHPAAVVVSPDWRARLRRSGLSQAPGAKRGRRRIGRVGRSASGL